LTIFSLEKELIEENDAARVVEDDDIAKIGLNLLIVPMKRHNLAGQTDPVEPEFLHSAIHNLSRIGLYLVPVQLGA
jgi:hypothetical protein